MLFRLVRPLKRSGSSFSYFQQRIPADLKDKVRGKSLALPVGSETVLRKIPPKAETIRFSLKTRDPSETKVRQAEVAAYLEQVWASYRNEAPLSLTQRQAVALSGALYRSWVDEGKERSIAVEEQPDGSFKRADVETPDERKAVWAAISEAWNGNLSEMDPEVLEPKLGPIVDRKLAEKGVGAVDQQSRLFLLSAFAQALSDAFATRSRNAAGDFTPDPKAERFPEWEDPKQPEVRPVRAIAPSSLTALIEGWWQEAKATQRAVSTYESYRNTMARFVDFLGHDDARRVTKADVIAFKDFRLAQVNPRSGKPVSPKTVKDSDLAGLRAVFNWAVVNDRMASNPAEGVTIKLGKQTRTRSKGFTQGEAKALLAHALNHQRGTEQPKTFAAKRWVPWLCAYSGARLGEIVQLRKQDILQEGGIWIMTLTPEAGTIKNKEAREVPLHEHLVSLGFLEFVRSSADGYLFLTPAKDGSTRGAWRGVKNRIAQFSREVVTDPNVAPNHGWRHLFKTIAIEAGIQERVIDAICGHAPKSVGATYGEVTAKAKADGLARFPRFEV
ncbi:tyrosine-type recombinase/integrase [Stappia sp. GBMRC 2046]|uniref:Tyrosine-type recombinase/integrase n=1 Tax=Stappia sediminis TaxID=2692190 RepID=A0A7X3S9F5_9HYPH|nr:tyrosine-type recombinase/integrase [Stappia sediminis]MXN66705.1 tyrosine-type recombinase/integrase [Stappia sediminis]